MRRKALLGVVAVVAVAVAYFVVHREREPALPRDGPVVAFRIDLDAPADSEVLHGYWPATKRLSLDGPIRAEVLAALHDPGNFRSGSNKCFPTGMVFRVGSGEGGVDALVCLECDVVYFFRVVDAQAYKGSKLTPAGHAAFLRVYRTIFGDAPDVTTTKPAK